jgi:hypothetical protein
MDFVAWQPVAPHLGSGSPLVDDEGGGHQGFVADDRLGCRGRYLHQRQRDQGYYGEIPEQV